MKHQASRSLRVSLGLLLFAAGGGQPGGFDLVAQQIEILGTRQWLGLMAGAAIAPVSQRIAGTLPHRLTHLGRTPERQPRWRPRNRNRACLTKEVAMFSLNKRAAAVALGLAIAAVA
jgi:hypothetical protein